MLEENKNKKEPMETASKPPALEKPTIPEKNTETVNNKLPSPLKTTKHAYVYLGPNLPGGALFTGSVYREKPEHIKKWVEKIPAIDELFIEAKDVPQFKRELKRSGSEAARIFQAVRVSIAEILREEAKKNNVRI